MIKFAYNNIKNISISYKLFELKYYYYLRESFDKNIDFFLSLKIANDLTR